MYSCSSNEMLVVEILLTWHCQSLYAVVIDYEDVFYEVIGIIRERCFIVRLSKYLYVFMYDLTQMFTSYPINNGYTVLRKGTSVSRKLISAICG